MSWTERAGDVVASRAGLSLPIVLLAFVGVSVFAANAIVDADPRLIQSDGESYYAWARSLLFDGDVDFGNEYRMRLEGEARERALGARTARGLPVNQYSIGLPLIEMAPTAAARAVESALGLDPGDQPGYAPIYQWSIALFLLGTGLAVIGGVFAHARARGDRLLGNLLCLGSLGATGLVEYVSRGISMTHLMDMALISGAWWLARRRSEAATAWIALGLVLGLAVVTRFTNALAVPWVFACAAWSGRRIGPRQAAFASLGAAVPMALQIAANVALWGEPFAEPYPSVHFVWLEPHVWGVLWSSERGWLAWHPWNAGLMLLAGASWSYYRRSRAGRWVVITALTATVVLTAVNAAWPMWTFGFGFGHRGFLALVPVLTLTVAPAMGHLGERWTSQWPEARVRSAAMLTVALLLGWNAYVWIGFNVIVVPSPGAEPTLAQCIGWPFRASSPF
jgi:hypothetical protein